MAYFGLSGAGEVRFLNGLGDYAQHLDSEAAEAAIT
jgi:hypothetical protein